MSALSHAPHTWLGIGVGVGVGLGSRLAAPNQVEPRAHTSGSRRNFLTAASCAASASVASPA
eukprot:scaffold14362_cov18-Phaeocystis_antarctica.AAC.1